MPMAESDSCSFMLAARLRSFKLAWLPSVSRNRFLHHPNAAHLLDLGVAINAICISLGHETFEFTDQWPSADLRTQSRGQAAAQPTRREMEPM